MRIVFLANVADFSPPFLEALAERSRRADDPVSVAAVICPVGAHGTARTAMFSAKRATGRALDLLEDRSAGLTDRIAERVSGVHRTMQRLAHRCGAPILWPTEISSADFRARVVSLDADLTLVAGLDRILSEATIDALPTAYNVHPSLLPDHRGAVPEFWQLDGGLPTAGVTVHRIDPGVDTGPIVLQRPFTIEPWYDAADLLARSVEIGVELLDELLDDPDRLGAGGRAQEGGSYQPIPGADERHVPLDRSAHGVLDRARAWGFSRALWLHVPADAWATSTSVDACEPSDSSLRLRLFDPVVHAGVDARAPGTVTRTARGSAVVWCADGAVEFRHVEVDGPTSATLDRTAP